MPVTSTPIAVYINSGHTHQTLDILLAVEELVLSALMKKGLRLSDLSNNDEVFL